MDENKREVVKNSLLFKGTGEPLISQVTAEAISRSVEDGGFFFMEGDPATHAYVLEQGRLKMMQVTPGGQQISLRIVTPGQTFGAVALISPKDGYPVSAQAMQDSRAMAWEVDKLAGYARMEPSIALNAMQLMHGYILELQDRQQVLVSGKVEQRIARIVLKLASQFGRKGEKGVVISLPLTRQDLAEMSGTTLFTVSRTLKEWERRGLVSLGRERVCVCDPHGLVRLSEGLENG